jgi:hypothetical protein
VIRVAFSLLTMVALAGCATNPAASNPPPVGTAAATQTTVEWAAVQLPDAVGNWQPSGVIEGADGFVIFGWINDQAAVWTSVNADDWTSIALPGFDGTPRQGAVSGDAIALVGTGGTARCAHPLGEFIWQRSNGDPAWHAAPFNENLFCAGGAPSIAANDDGFVIAGTGSGEQPFAWVSDDGLAWHDASAGLGFDAPPWIVGGTDMGFVALGRGAITDVHLLAAGRGWAAIPAPPVAPAFNGDLPGMTPAALIATARGTLVLYASEDDLLSSAWRRREDESWSEVTLDGLEQGDHADGGPLLGAGTADEQAVLFVVRDDHAVVLTSTDLTSWSALPIPELDRVRGLAEFDHRLVLVGSRTAPDGSEQGFVFSAAAPPR